MKALRQEHSWWVWVKVRRTVQLESSKPVGKEWEVGLEGSWRPPLCKIILVCLVSPWDVIVCKWKPLPKITISYLILYPGPMCPVEEGSFPYPGYRVPTLETKDC